MNNCIEWNNARDPKGYGRQSRDGKMYLAHRLAWADAHGPIPAGMVVMHTCDNPPCVNIEHLVLGTQVDNLLDASAKGRLNNSNAAKTHCLRGHEFNEVNTWTAANGKHRNCRVCAREARRVR